MILRRREDPFGGLLDFAETTVGWKKLDGGVLWLPGVAVQLREDRTGGSGRVIKW